MTPTISKTRVIDLWQVEKLARSITINENTSSDRGFLLAGHSVLGYLALLISTPYFYLARDRNMLKGFIIAFSSTSLPFFFLYPKIGRKIEWQDEKARRIFQEEQFIFVDQVGVLSSYQRQEIGRKLCQHLFVTLKYRYKYLFAAITCEPIENRASVKFAQKLGFFQVGVYHPNVKAQDFDQKAKYLLTNRFLLVYKEI